MVDRLLNELKKECLRKPFSALEALRALESLLGWLSLPENNTDENCRKVDVFVMTEIHLSEEAPEELRAILEDVGGALHDTHRSPEIARNFESTPDQLLARTRDLILRSE